MRAPSASRRPPSIGRGLKSNLKNASDRSASRGQRVTFDPDKQESTRTYNVDDSLSPKSSLNYSNSNSQSIGDLKDKIRAFGNGRNADGSLKFDAPARSRSPNPVFRASESSNEDVTQPHRRSSYHAGD